jgi:hypothetical protein
MFYFQFDLFIIIKRPSFKEIVHRLDSIIPEVEKLEFQTKLQDQIQNKEGVEWWSSKVRIYIKLIIF